MNEFGGSRNENNPGEEEIPKPVEGKFIIIEPIAEYKKPVPDEVVTEGESSYEVFKPETLRLRDLGRNDRAFVTTKSGTEFMIRFSQRHGGFKLYSKAHGLLKGRRIIDSPSDSNLLADLNSSLRVVTEGPEYDNHDDQVWVTSPIQEIKIIKNIDSDVQAHKVLNLGTLK